MTYYVVLLVWLHRLFGASTTVFASPAFVAGRGNLMIWNQVLFVY